jgi:hypothetical protein
MTLKLRDINFIIFPDPLQIEESIDQDLVDVITTLENHPEHQRISLIINTSNFSNELTEALIDFLDMCQPEEDTERLAISFLSKLKPMEWEALLPRLTGRIVLTHEDQKSLSELRSDRLPFWQVEKQTEVFKHSCPVCSSPVKEFHRLPDFYYQKLDQYGHIFSIFQTETINWLNYSCPVCGASDRDRLYALYFNKERPEVQPGFRLLDIAPSKALQNFIKNKYSDINYRSADLMMGGVDDVIDITQMDIYDDSNFDFFICSHVLEHIENDIKAMGELYRVLKPGGKGIAMVPIMLSLESDYENPEITTPEGRWKHFGQDDHVRMYSKPGFIKKLTSTGFVVHQLDINFFGSEAFDKHGIHPRSVLYIVEKLSQPHSIKS